MMMVTTHANPGHRIAGAQRAVVGLTVRSRHIGSTMGASLTSIGGGELKGGNAVVDLYFETNDYTETGGVAVHANGTSVTIEQA